MLRMMHHVNDLRLELRTRNNILWHVIFDHYESFGAFCRAHELSQQHVGAYLNLKLSPYLSDAHQNKRRRQRGPIHALAAKLCEVAQMSPVVTERLMSNGHECLTTMPAGTRYNALCGAIGALGLCRTQAL
jgi:hypothetical protein